MIDIIAISFLELGIKFATPTLSIIIGMLVFIVMDF